MDRLEELIRRGLSNRQRGILVEKTIYCPDEDKLIDYIYSDSGAQDIEPHIVDCPWCIEQIVLAQEAETQSANLPVVPSDAIRRAKDIVPARQAVSPRARALKRNLWLIATLIAFTLSFIIPRYFQQFLFAALILGMKWVAESEQIRTLIVTLDSRRREKKNSDIPSNRLKTKIEDHS